MVFMRFATSVQEERCCPPA